MKLSTDVALFLFAFPVLVLSQERISCNTQIGEEGICVSAKQCPYVIEMQTRYGDEIPRIIQNEIRQMACDGEIGARLPICCPKNSMLNARIGIPETHLESTLKTSLDLNYIDPNGIQILDSVSECGKGSNLPSLASFDDSTNTGGFPWLVLLKYEIIESGPFLCSGSLITARFVLTAAHCTTTSAKIIDVRFAEHNLVTREDCTYHNGNKADCLPPHEEFGIEEIRPHPYFKKDSIIYDIALIKLLRSVTFGLLIKPICLPIDRESKDIENDQTFFISGWGTAESGTPSSVPHKALVTRQDLDVCRNHYVNATLDENHICAVVDDNQETSHGDSGGSLFTLLSFNKTDRFVQYGVISFGGQPSGINETQPGVFASVLDMLPWITQNLD